MADFDWGNFATSLIPAAVGGAAGGLRGGAYGLAAGIADQGRQRIEVEKANADIAFRNIHARQQQEEIGLRRESLDLSRQQEDRIARSADYANRIAEIQAKALERQFSTETETLAGQQRLRSGLTPQEQTEFDADPDKKGWIDAYRKRKEADAKIAGAGPLLESLGFKNGEQWKTILGPEGVARAFEIRALEQSNMRLAAARAAGDREMKPTFHMIGDIPVILNPNSMTLTPVEIKSPALDSKRRIAAEKAAVAQQFGDTLVAGQADRYLNSLEGQLHVKYLAGELPREAYLQTRQQVEGASLSAKAKMFEAWKKENTGKSLNKELTLDALDSYIQTPAGAANFESWKRVELGGRLDQRPAPSGAPATSATPPINRPFSVDVREGAVPADSADRKTIMGPGGRPYNVPRSAKQDEIAKVQEALRAAGAAPAPAAAPTSSDKRPSLDSIFGR